MRDKERTAAPKQGPATLTTAQSMAIPLGVTEAYLSALPAAIATLMQRPTPASSAPLTPGDGTGCVPYPRTSTRRSHDDSHR